VSASDSRPTNVRILVWAIALVAASSAVVGYSLEYFGGASHRFVPSYSGGGPDYLFTIPQFVALGFGALICIRKPRNPIGWLLMVSASAFLIDPLVIYYVVYAIHVSHRALPGADILGNLEPFLWLPGVMPIALFLPLLFPDGRLLSRRWRAVVALAVLGLIGLVGQAFGSSPDTSSLVLGVRPFVGPRQLQPIASAIGLAFPLLPLAVIGAIVSLGLRYRRAGSEERHQIKWLLFAIAVYGFGFLASVVGGSVLQGDSAWLQTIATIGLILIPLATAVAVLRYHVYDIDIVISRTLVYGTLAALITAVYVGIVVGIGTLIGQGSRPNLGLSIVATAVVAVGFQPVRERLQKIANRLVYGKRATPYEVLSEFSERVAESYSADDVLPRMARVLAEGTGAEKAAVWLRTGSELRPAAIHPAEANGLVVRPVSGQLLPVMPEADRAVPVRHQGELLGALSVSKRRGESLTPIEEKLLDDLAHQAGLVLKNVGLTADLQARLEDLRESRKRLVAAQDQERRRLERNLHDGAQQHLVALKVKLGLAEMLAAKDPEKAKATIAELKSDADEALETLRDLARGIYPPLLADKGLVAALEAHARKATVPVTVEAEGIGRYPQEVEAAVYFCVLEALQNVQKYAHATQATVRLGEGPPPNPPPAGGGRSPILTFEVEDDGRGFDSATVTRGAGLTNMSDRLDALGGRLEIESVPGAGTRLRGHVPLALTVGR